MKNKQEEIFELLDKANSVKGGNDYFVDFGQVTKTEADKLKEILNLDLTGFVRILDISGVKHAKKEHPNLTDSDFLLIPFIVNNYDMVGYGKQQNIIVYKKLIGHEYFYVEQIRKGRKKLAIKTYYKRKKRSVS